MTLSPSVPFFVAEYINLNHFLRVKGTRFQNNSKSNEYLVLEFNSLILIGNHSTPPATSLKDNSTPSGTMISELSISSFVSPTIPIIILKWPI